MTPCDIIIKSEYENWCRAHKQDQIACWAQERNELRAERDALKLQVDELCSKMEEIRRLLFAPGPGTETPLVNIDMAFEIASTYARSENRKCGLTKPLGNGETCVLEVGHIGPCDHKRINEICWCAAKTKAKDAKCPIHDLAIP